MHFSRNFQPISVEGFSQFNIEILYIQNYIQDFGLHTVKVLDDDFCLGGWGERGELNTSTFQLLTHDQN